MTESKLRCLLVLSGCVFSGSCNIFEVLLGLFWPSTYCLLELEKI